MEQPRGMTRAEQREHTRQRIIDLTADQDVLMLGTHFAPPTAGHVRRNDGEARFVAFRGPDAAV